MTQSHHHLTVPHQDHQLENNFQLMDLPTVIRQYQHTTWETEEKGWFSARMIRNTNDNMISLSARCNRAVLRDLNMLHFNSWKSSAILESAAFTWRSEKFIYLCPPRHRSPTQHRRLPQNRFPTQEPFLSRQINCPLYLRCFWWFLWQGWGMRMTFLFFWPGGGAEN